MIKGTYEGNLDEIKFVSLFNSNKENFSDFLSNFSSFNNLWMVQVTTKQFSQLSQKKVFTRADCYLASINFDISTILKENNYYLSEELLNTNNIPYTKISNSGISIKMTSSTSFQILKIGPNSFYTLFNSYELGAGASLFCQKEKELIKNKDLITGWNTTPQKMSAFFSKYTNNADNFYLDISICKKIKNYSCKEIKNLIENSIDLQKKIFNGITLYEEPYSAHYFYHGENIVKLTTIPFNVTTGSGRSKGDYTIVLKP